MRNVAWVHLPQYYLVLMMMLLLLLHATSIVASSASRPIVTRGSRVTRLVYNNTARIGPAVHHSVDTVTTLPLTWQTDTNTESSSSSSSSSPCAGALMGSLTFDTPGFYQFDCTFVNTHTAWIWIDGHLICQDNHTAVPEPGNSDNPLHIRQTDDDKGPKQVVHKKQWPLRAHLTAQNCAAASMQISWHLLNTTTTLHQAITHHDISPHLPKLEQRRQALQHALAKGWGTWLHADAMSIVKLPEGMVLEIRICQNVDPAAHDGAFQLLCTTASMIPDRVRQMRVGLYATDRSYAQTYASLYDNNNKKDKPVLLANVSLTFGATGDNRNDLDVLITPVYCRPVDNDNNKNDNDNNNNACENYEIRFQGRHAWRRIGTVQATAQTLTFQTTGLASATTLYTSPSKNHRAYLVSNSSIAMPLSSSIALSTQPGTTVHQVQLRLDTSRQAEQARLHATFGDKAAVATAIQAAVMWSLTYVPTENGPLLPVSRAWQAKSPPDLHSDWWYVIFDWDNFFAALLAALVAPKEIVYSNLIQVVKAKTSGGFIPNLHSAGWSSQDRSQPPIGAKVTLELYRKYQDKWLVELLFDDLLEWNDWFLQKRVLHPAGLLTLGSWNEQAVVIGQGDLGNRVKCAKWESGLDNSPMYDEPGGDLLLFNNETHLMNVYDVGFSSMFTQDAYALSELALVLGRQEEGNMLQQRGDAMAAKIRQHLWDPVGKLYTNKLINGTFYRRITPTSFYAMMTGAPSDAQAQQMITHWLVNASRFCVTNHGDFKGNTDDCYWGLPSINAADPAFPPLGYWRGYIWGPMVQLVYWSLQRYEHIPVVRQAQVALCRQMEALMMNHWHRNRQICENYHPRKDYPWCSGTGFYHWGALTGLIGMIDAGYMYPQEIKSSKKAMNASAATS